MSEKDGRVDGREKEFVGGYHEERTEEPHAQRNLRFYQGSGIWDQGVFGWGYSGYGVNSNFGSGAHDGSGEGPGFGEGDFGSGGGGLQ